MSASGWLCIDRVMFRRIQTIAYWPALFASLLLCLVTLQAVAWSVKLNDGHLIYGLDDAYIHVSIAKNFAQHGVWGVTQYGYTSASSSPLWTGILALLYFLLGDHAIMPLVLNLIFALGLMFAINRLLRKCDVPALYRLIILAAVVILLPLDSLILSGMEHVLQILVCILFLDAATDLLTRDHMPKLTARDSILVCILGALTATARYEGLFLVAIFCLMFALRRRLIYGVLLGIISIAPIMIYGLIAIANGWTFLPPSLLLKSSAIQNLSGASFDQLKFYLIDEPLGIFANHTLTLPLVAALFIFLFRYEKRRTLWDSGLVMLIAFIGVTYLNIRLVSWPFPGPLLRYEAYLIPLALIVIPAALGEYLPRRIMLHAFPAYVVSAILLLFVLRGIYTRYLYLTFNTPIVTATQNIYWQQIQMADFLKTYYEGATVAANDIGAINYFADLHNVDLYGLANIDVVHLKRENHYDTDAIRGIASEEGAQIAVIYSIWFDAYGGLPPEWTLVGEWSIQSEKNVVLGFHVVSFYAINPDLADSLSANLTTFAPRLPSEVNWWSEVPLR